MSSNHIAVPFDRMCRTKTKGSNMGVLLVVSFVLGVFLVLSSAVNANSGKLVSAWLEGIGAVAAFALAVLFGAFVIGHGTVPGKAEKIATRLKSGTAYQVVASFQDGADLILTVKDTKTSGFYALRVKQGGRPPEHFTLINGKPIAIVSATPPDKK